MIPVVITGRGLITPIGLSLAENLESLKTGKSGITRIPYWQELNLDSQVAGSVNLEGFECPAFDRKQLRFMTQSGVMAVAAAYEAITRVPGYGVAKEGVSNFTKWLAAEVALKYGDKIRVNALAPGFFIGKQNRCALLNDDGSLTERSHKVIAKTPMGRFGDITELNGAAQFLCSDAASFITGVVLPVDGGFSSFSGV